MMLINAMMRGGNPPAAGGGATPHWYDDFSTGDKTFTENGCGWYGSGVNTTVITGFGYGGSANCMEFDYGASGVDAEQRFYFDTERKEWWFDWWEYWPDGTESPDRGEKFMRTSGSQNNKFLRLFGGTNLSEQMPRCGAEEFMQFPEVVAGDNAIELEAYEVGDTGVGVFDGAGTKAQGFTVDAVRGQWNHIRFYVKVSTTESSADGEERLWLNGVMRAEVTGVNFFLDGNNSAGVGAGYVHGSCNTPMNPNTKLYISNWAVYITDPDA